MSAVRFVEYQQEGEPLKRAGVVKVDLDLSTLTQRDLHCLTLLTQACHEMNAVFRAQFCAATPLFEVVIPKLISVASSPEKEILKDYWTIFQMQNGPFSELPKKNHLLRISPEQALQLARQASCEGEYEQIKTLLFEGKQLLPTANFYPSDITEKELDSLGPDAKRPNTLIRRTPDGLRCIVNEDFFRAQCRRAAELLLQARDYVDGSPSFQLFLDAKIEELRTGSEEARRVADALWIRHDFKIDLILSTAIEVYVDAWKNIKGSAAAAAMIRNPSLDKLLRMLEDNAERLEKNAPSPYFRQSIPPSTLPNLRFVDVVDWCGDYNTGPLTTLAQSLPNDEWLVKAYGSVNLVYANTGDAVYRVVGQASAQEFLPAEILEQYGPLLHEGDQIHCALHEIGHTTGRMDPAHSKGEPRDYLEAEYSALEECRAELFGMYGVSALSKSGHIAPALAEAAHYAMLLTLVNALKYDPEQAHQIARNMMFHCFCKEGVIERVPSPRGAQFRLRLGDLDACVSRMLTEVQALKSTGDKAGTIAFRQKYCQEDPHKEEIRTRTLHFPTGRALIFPQIRMVEGNTQATATSLASLDYAQEYYSQPKFAVPTSV